LETDSRGRKEVVEGVRIADVLHRVLYPQVHDDGIKKKEKSLAGETAFIFWE